MEKGREDEDESQGEIAGDGNRLVVLGRGDTDVYADVEHAEGLADGRDEERPTTTERVGHEEQEDAARHDLDNAVDASAEQGVRGSLDAEIREDGRRVDVDGIGSGQLLEDHEQNAQHCAVAVALDQPHLLLQSPEGCVTHDPSLVLQLLGDLAEFLLEVRVVVGELPEGSQDILGLLPPVFASEISGRLVADQHQREEEQSREALNGQRHDIFGRAIQVQLGSEVRPEGDQTAGDDEKLVHAGEQSTNGSRCVLRDIDGVDHT